jgi:tRNA pseudouridine32 synthase / 23S rRNA pseudouridine746 synthase
VTAPVPHGLPTQAGVSPSCVSLPGGNWPTLLDFLSERFPAVARDVWLARMANGLVADEFGSVITPARAASAYRSHIRIYYYRDVPHEPRIPFEEHILFQDAHLVVADKPHFLPVTPSGNYLQETLLVRLKNRLGIDDLVPIHRIDRETAGIVVFAVQRAERDAYQALFRRHAVDKDYLAIAPFRADLSWPQTRKSRIVEDEPFFRQREVEGDANSETHIALLEQCGEMARYALKPVTGKKHQLRVHMHALGIAISNDRMYPPVTQTPDDDFDLPLQLLAKSIAFTDPVTGEPRRFTSARQLRDLSQLALINQAPLRR